VASAAAEAGDIGSVLDVLAMSALGTKRTCRSSLATSAIKARTDPTRKPTLPASVRFHDEIRVFSRFMANSVVGYND
jgi:hypothetical protein